MEHLEEGMVYYKLLFVLKVGRISADSVASVVAVLLQNQDEGEWRRWSVSHVVVHSTALSSSHANGSLWHC